MLQSSSEVGFVFFSRNEGLSLALLQAMSTGMAIVASDIPSNIEALAETGITVSTKDRRAAARTVLSLIDDPRRRERLGKAARSRALEHFSIASLVSTFERHLSRWASVEPA